MNAPNAYLGGRTCLSSDSRRSLLRLRQQSEEKKPLSGKQVYQANSFVRTTLYPFLISASRKIVR